jgi:2-(1,2-epoxy-1,2-dihydrophenyl)acetyl-CoA isomerase
MGQVEPTVTVEGDDDVAVIRLHRPPHNLLTEPILRSLADSLHALEPGTVAVLCSEGRTFCAGADFRSDEAPDPTDVDAFTDRTAAFYRQAVRVFASPVPVVAAVQGGAVGAGFGLALACDVRVAGDGAWFQANFVRLGIHPGFALSLTIPRIAGEAAAAELLLTGRRVDAEEAAALGLAQVRTAAGDETERAVEVAGRIASGAPLAVAATRATLRRGLVDAAEATMDHELAEQSLLAGSHDAIEGVDAMLHGRVPHFEGR